LNSRSILTGLAILVLFFSVINNFNWNSQPVTDIAYSDFLTFLDRGQIAAVNLKGDRIKGATSNGKAFATTGTYDPTLLDKLRASKVSIKVESEEDTPWYLALLLQWGPLLLLVGVWVFMMRKMPGMKHAEPNMITLNAGQTGGIVWQFDKAGEVDFACLIPGHMEAGMVGKVKVK